MATDKTRRSRRVRDDVAAMRAKRDQLDRDQEEQRRLEESAFERYAQAQARTAEVEQGRDETLGELDRRREQAVAEAERELEAIGAEQCAVLAELHGRRRSAEDLAAMFGLPVKRVRTMLRRVRDDSPSSAGGGGGGRAELASVGGGPQVTDERGSRGGHGPDRVDSRPDDGSRVAGGVGAVRAVGPG